MPDHRIRAGATAVAPWTLSRPLRRAYRRWQLRGLLWCHGCGAMVQRLGADELCVQCEEIDARLASHMGAAAQDLTERMLELALNYLHPDDVRDALCRLSAERDPATEPLSVLHGRSHAFVGVRVHRTSRGTRQHASRGRPHRD